MINKRRLPALLLAVSLLLSCLGGISFGAAAAEAPTDTSVADAQLIELWEEYPLTLSEGEAKYFKFIPDEDGTYTFRSYNETGDPYGELFDSDLFFIDGSDDAIDSNFRIKTQLTAGNTYYFRARNYKDRAGSMTVQLTKEKTAALLEVIDNPFEYIEYDPGRGDWDWGYVDDEQVDYFRYHVSYAADKLTLKVTYTDGTTDTLTRTNDTWNEIEYSSEQSASSPWTVGGDNTATVTFRGVSATFSANIVAIDDIAVPLAVDEPYRLTLEDYEEAFFSFTPSEYGYYAFYSCDNTGDPYAYLYDSSMSEIGSDDDGGEDSNFKIKVPLTAGNTYYFRVGGYSSSAVEMTVQLTKEKTAVALEVIDNPFVYTENDAAYGDWGWDYVGDEQVEYFYYQPYYAFDALTLKVTYSDDSSETLTRNDGKWGEVMYSSEQSASSPWTVGGDNPVTVTFQGVSATFSARIASLADLAVPLTLNVPREVDHAASGYLYFSFTPAKTGRYYFYTTGLMDTQGVLYDDSGLQIASDEDSYDDINFLIPADLEAGKTYYLQTDVYDNDTGRYAVTVTDTAIDTGYETIEGKDLTGKYINILLAVDTTGSMSDEINNVRNNLKTFVSKIAATGAALRISLIDYKDVIEDGWDSTVVHYSPAYSLWFENGDIDALCDEIGDLDATGGGDTPESVVDALGYATDTTIMQFNSEAAKFIFLVTDADYKEENRHGIADMDDLIARLKENEITATVITDKSYYADYRKLASETGGKLINIYSDFEKAMEIFAAQVVKTAEEHTVDPSVVPVTGISFDSDLTIPLHKVKNFIPLVTPSNATNKGVTFRIEDESIARISDFTSDGMLVIEGVASGETRIIASSMDGGYTASFVLTVAGEIHVDGDVAETCDIGEALNNVKSDTGAKETVFYAEGGEALDVAPAMQQEFFEAIDGKDKIVCFVSDDALGNMRYTWSFDGKKVVDPTITVNMDVAVGDEESPVTPTAKEAFYRYLTVDFAHSGDLPGQAEFSCPADLPDGDYPLYYFDPATKELRESGKATVKDKIARFALSHCSSYVFGTTEPDPCTEHKTKLKKAKAATCTAAGYTGDQVCTVCGKVIKKGKAIAKLGHKLVTKVTVKATYFKAGKKVTKCSVCGKVTKTVTLAKKVLKTPKVTVTAKKKALSVKVAKVTAQTGFQIRYRLKGSKKWTTKTFKTAKTATKTLKSLKAKKNYQLQARAMIQKGKSKAYSKWSKVITKKTK